MSTQEQVRAEPDERMPGSADGRDEPEPADWPELEVTAAPPARRPIRRPRVLLPAVAFLAVGGVGGLVNAILTPFLPEALANVAPVLSGLLGAGGLVAAAGVWRLDDWGRFLGLGVALGWLLRDALLTQAAMSLGLDPVLGRTPDPLFDWVLPLVLDAAILAILGLGWPSGPDRPD